MNDPNFQAKAKAYVRFVLDEMKMSATALAKEAGLAPTTLTRALHDPSHKYTLSLATLGKIVAASGINFNAFMQTEDVADMYMAAFERPDLYDESWGVDIPSDKQKTRNFTHVIGSFAHGVWKAPNVASMTELPPIGLALLGTAEVETFALIADDDSAWPFVRKGEKALCIRRKGATWQLRHGDLLVIERWLTDQGLVELSLRRLVMPDGGAPYLKFDNPDPRHIERLILPRTLESTPELKIIGTVSYAVRDTIDSKLSEEAWAKDRAKPNSA